jgi:hypothetical protein
MVRGANAHWREKVLFMLIRATGDKQLCQVLNISQEKLIAQMIKALEIPGLPKKAVETWLRRFGPCTEKVWPPPEAPWLEDELNRQINDAAR